MERIHRRRRGHFASIRLAGALQRERLEVRSRIDNPVEPRILQELNKKFADFRRAFEPEWLSIDQFDSFAPTRRTPRQFISACHDLGGIIRDIMIPNPDAA